MSENSAEYTEILASGLFLPAWYLDQHQDVAGAGVDPLEHYLAYGAAEGRDPNPEFSSGGYLARYHDVADAGINPLLHFIRYGQREGRLTTPFGRPVVRPYRHFGEYLAHSMTDPLLKAPFAEVDRHCFAVMGNVARSLCLKVRECEQPPPISVIMPVRDRAALVGEAIRSVLAQSYRHFELIVVDDGSRDDSAGVVRAFADPRIQLLADEEPRGVSAARNRGLGNARGDLIAYLDSDNTWLPDYLGAMAGAFQLLPDAAAAYGGQYLFQGSEATPFAVRFGSYNPSLLRNSNYIDLNCFVHRRAILEAIGGGFCEEIKRWVDWELILRMSEIGKIYSIPVLQSNYHLEKAENTISATEESAPAHEFIMARSGYGQGRVGEIVPPLTRKVAIIVHGDTISGHPAPSLDALAELSSNPLVRIIVAVNASGADAAERGGELSGAVNRSAQSADAGSDLLLLHPGAVLTPAALGALQEAAYAGDSIAITAPQRVLAGGDPAINSHVPYAYGDVPCDVTLSRQHTNVGSLPGFHGGGTVELNYAPFSCVYIKRPVWERCGGLAAGADAPAGADRLMCDFVRHVLGMRIVYTPAAVVYHRTTRINPKALSTADGRG